MGFLKAACRVRSISDNRLTLEILPRPGVEYPGNLAHATVDNPEGFSVGDIVVLEWDTDGDNVRVEGTDSN